METQDRLSGAFAALADPTRRDILTRLRRGPSTVNDLAMHYPMSRPAVSQHLGVLERAGLIRRDRRSQWIDCTLVDSGLAEATSWLERQRADWNDRFDRLDNHLEHRRTDTSPTEDPHR